ncbi:hypothetical protein Pelo_2146 [Pelomyxa schiedti]|nr:hypothetical protein Pelo_2146 [Pelomyxa schiedti]
MQMEQLRVELAEKATLQEKVKDLTSKLKSLQEHTRKQSQQTFSELLESELLHLDEVLQSEVRAKEHPENADAKTSEELNKTINALQQMTKENAILSDSVARLQQSECQLTEENKSLKSTISHLQQQLNKLQNKCLALISALQLQRKECQTHQASLISFSGTVKEQQATITSFQEVKSLLLSQNDSLRKQVSELQQDNAHLRSVVDNLRSEKDLQRGRPQHSLPSRLSNTPILGLGLTATSSKEIQPSYKVTLLTYSTAHFIKSPCTDTEATDESHYNNSENSLCTHSTTETTCTDTQNPIRTTTLSADTPTQQPIIKMHPPTPPPTPEKPPPMAASPLPPSPSTSHPHQRPISRTNSPHFPNTSRQQGIPSFSSPQQQQQQFRPRSAHSSGYNTCHLSPHSPQQQTHKGTTSPTSSHVLESLQQLRESIIRQQPLPPRTPTPGRY